MKITRQNFLFLSRKDLLQWKGKKKVNNNGGSRRSAKISNQKEKVKIQKILFWGWSQTKTKKHVCWFIHLMFWLARRKIVCVAWRQDEISPTDFCFKKLLGVIWRWILVNKHLFWDWCCWKFAQNALFLLIEKVLVVKIEQFTMQGATAF